MGITIFNGKTHYKWPSFNSYVGLPEGTSPFQMVKVPHSPRAQRRRATESPPPLRGPGPCASAPPQRHQSPGHGHHWPRWWGSPAASFEGRPAVRGGEDFFGNDWFVGYTALDPIIINSTEKHSSISSFNQKKREISEGEQTCIILIFQMSATCSHLLGQPLAAICSHLQPLALSATCNLQPLAATWQTPAPVAAASGCQVAAKWLQVAASGCQVATKWLPSGCRVPSWKKSKLVDVAFFFKFAASGCQTAGTWLLEQSWGRKKKNYKFTFFSR